MCTLGNKIFDKSRENQEDYGHILGSNGWDFQSINAVESQLESAKKGKLGDCENKSKIRRNNDRISPSSFPLIDATLHL